MRRIALVGAKVGFDWPDHVAAEVTGAYLSMRKVVCYGLALWQILSRSS